MNSASVSGGCPESVHDSAPPQSPVEQLPRPEPSKLQPVRPHTLPELVPAGTLMVHVSPGLSCLPPPTGVAAGHTVNEHRLVMVKVAALAPPAARVATRTTTRIAEEVAGDAINYLLYFDSLFFPISPSPPVPSNALAPSPSSSPPPPPLRSPLAAAPSRADDAAAFAIVRATPSTPLPLDPAAGTHSAPFADEHRHGCRLRPASSPSSNSLSLSNPFHRVR